MELEPISEEDAKPTPSGCTPNDLQRSEKDQRKRILDDAIRIGGQTMTDEEKSELDEVIKFLHENPDIWYGVEYIPTLDEEGNDVGGVYRFNHNGNVWDIDPSLLKS